MPSRPQADEIDAIVKLTQWFQTPAGQYVWQWEHARLDAAVADVFGYHALQAGLPDFDTLRANRMPFRAYVGPTRPHAAPQARWQGVVAAALEDLPLASQSIDLLVLPHGLEYAKDPHSVLREAERVLMPEGRLVITGFNPLSLWGIRHWLGRSDWLPECGRFIPLPQLKDWLKLLSFELDRGHFGCYAPPVATEKWLQRYAFMEKAGDRWWPVCGAVYVVSAIKRVPGMRLVGPAWKKKRTTPARASVLINHRVPSRNFR